VTPQLQTESSGRREEGGEDALETARDSLRTLLWVLLFTVAFAFIESSIVVYLRGLYYPGGLTFPLKMMDEGHLRVELVREVATLVVLLAVAMIAGSTGWQKIAFFLVAFGVWDIFYYVWLKVTLNWPSSLTDWDVLFLIPMPWIAPMIAPVLLALLMSVCGGIMIFRLRKGLPFRPRVTSWMLGTLGTAVTLYTFLYESPSILRGGSPSSYPYGLLAVSLAMYLIGFVAACSVPRRD